MSSPENNLRIDYVEIPVVDVPATKAFYSALLGWKFEDYGPDYTCFNDGRLGGGFYKADEGTVQTGGALLVIYTTDLEGLKAKVIEAGGKIVKDTFDFPGGKRFHFTDPSGHVLAFWSNL